VFGGQEIEQMNLHRQLVALFVILAVAPGQGQAPSAPYSRDSGADMRNGADGGGGGGGGGM
jgi:hypothetical protein